MSNCYVRSDPADPKSPKICTKGFPYPIMDETLIVFPLQSEDERKKYVDQFEENISQSSEEKMDYIDKCKVNYVKIKAILDALAYVQVKKLRSNEPFPLENKLEQLLKASKMTHIQFVINSYALISYITAYMMKANAKISKLLKTAIEEVQTKTNLTQRQKLQSVANCWHNGSEISAQEYVYHLMSMPLSH